MSREWIVVGPGRYLAADSVIRYDCPLPGTLVLHTAAGKIELPPEDQPQLDLGGIIRALRGEAKKKGKK